MLFIVLLLAGFAGSAQKDSVKAKKKNGGYAMIGLAFNSAHGGGFGGSISAGFKGSKKAPAIGIGIDILKLADLNKVYLPVYLNISPFIKWFFFNFKLGYAGYNDYSSSYTNKNHYSGGFYGALGCGVVLPVKGKVAPFIAVNAARMPLYIGENDLTKYGGQISMGIKF